MSIEKLITEAVQNDGLTALTVWPSSDGWQCNARFKRGNREGWNCVTAKDPVAGLKQALAQPNYGMTPEPAAPAAEPDLGGVFE